MDWSIVGYTVGILSSIIWYIIFYKCRIEEKERLLKRVNKLEVEQEFTEEQLDEIWKYIKEKDTQCKKKQSSS